MQELLLKKKLNYLQCDKQGFHNGEYLNYVCVDTNCKNQGLICAICRNNDHKNHHVITFKEFLYQIANNLQSYKSNSNPLDIDDILQNIESIHQNNQYALKQLVMSISEQVKKIEEQICENYRNIKKKLISQAQLRDTMPDLVSSIINGDYNNVQQLQQDCNKMIDSISFKKEKIVLDFNPDKSLKLFSNYQNQFKNSISEMTKNIEKQFEKPLNLMQNIHKITLENTNDISLSAQLKFSQNLKSTFIKTEQNELSATQTTSSHQEKRIALLEPKLDNKVISKWAIKISKFISWVGVGISFGNVLKKLDYKFDYQKQGHGNMQLSSNGYTWNSCDLSQNTKMQGFKFGNQDVLLLAYDPIKLQLDICKYGDKKQKYTFKGIVIPKDDDVHASVNLGNTQEQVTVLPWNKDYDSYVLQSGDDTQKPKTKTKDLFEPKNPTYKTSYYNSYKGGDSLFDDDFY